MKRLLTSAALVLTAAGIADGQQIRHVIEREPGFANAAEASALALPTPGEVIIELDTSPALDRLGSDKTIATAEITDLLDRLERDVARIEGHPSDDLSLRSGRTSPILQHRYSVVFAGASATVSPDSIDAIERLPYVRAVHPDRAVRALLHESVEQIGATKVWNEHDVRGAGVVVAIIDTGIDYTHPALGGGLGEGFKVVGGHDFVNNDDDPMDDAGHGTHVAGIVAANGAGLVGVAPDASLLAYKVLDATGSGRDSSVMAGIEAAVADGADVVNMSLGRPAAPNDPVIRALENAFEGGVLFCVAAGNTGKFIDIGSPARAPNAVTVGAIDRNGTIASFSSRGPVAPSAAIKPEIVAPGVGIVSAVPGGGTQAFSGTSMATPHVAGVAALVLSAHPEWPPILVRAALISGAKATGAEVMAGGAGFVFAPDAVVADIFPSPSEISFGVANAAVTSVKRALYFTNASEETRTVALSVEGLRQGIELHVSASELEIAPAEAKRVDLEMVIDHEILPAPVAGSLSYGGWIRVAGATGSLTVPVSVTKASRVRVTWTGTTDAQIRLGTEGMSTSAYSSGGSTDLFVGAGDVSLWLTAGEFSSTTYHVFRENLDLGETTEISLSTQDAPHSIRFNGRDAFGRPLADRGQASLRELIMLHPRFSDDLFGAITVVGTNQEVRSSDIPETVRILAFERAFDIAKLTSWSVPYPHANGLTGDLDFDFDTNLWVKLPLVGKAPKSISRPYHLFFSSVWIQGPNYLLTSTATPSIGLSQTAEIAEATPWLIPTTGSGYGTSTVFEIGKWPDEPAPETLPENAYMRAQFSGVEGGAVPGRASAPRLADRLEPSGRTVVIGEGPVIPSLFVGASNTLFGVTLRWFGPHREYRLGDAAKTTAALFHESGQSVELTMALPSIITSGAFAATAELPFAGAYRFEATSDAFDLAGMTAAGTITTTFDTTAEDPVPPMLTSLRVENAVGGASPSILRGSTATAIFSAIDIGESGYQDIARESVSVSWRRHGSDDAWLPLSVVVSDDDLDSGQLSPFTSPDGVLFHADLSAISHALTGPADLRFSVSDSTGNSMVYVIEPGVVIQSGRRHPVTRP